MTCSRGCVSLAACCLVTRRVVETSSSTLFNKVVLGFQVTFPYDEVCLSLTLAGELLVLENFFLRVFFCVSFLG